MPYRFKDAQSFDPLSAPCRADFVAINAPHFFSVVFEKSAIEFLAKSISNELFQVGFRFNWKCRRFQIAEANSHGLGQSEVRECLNLQTDRIIKKFAQIINSRFALQENHT